MAEIAAELIVVLLLVIANGIFAGAEIAVVTLRATRVRELAAEGRSGGRAILALKQQPERFLATVQIGITVVGATAAAFGGEAIATRLAPPLRDVSWIGEHAQGTALAIVVAGVSFLSIVLGELVPKSLALRSAERFARALAQPLLALSWAMKPLVWLLSASANVVLRPFGDRTTFTESRYSAEELHQLVDEATEAGTIHPDAGEIASRALELPGLTAVDVMVPSQDVITIPRHASGDELRRILLEHTHSRLPVHEDRIDNIVGYIIVKDLLAMAWEQKLIVLEDVMRPAYFVPESKPAVELLKEMRARHVPFAIVVDEHGGMSGIVTIDDLIEELVGEIFSEHARQPPREIVTDADGSTIVNGTTPIREINRALHIELPEDGPWTSIAGLYLVLSGRVPAPGESVTLPSGAKLEIVEASPRRIRAVRIRPPQKGRAPG